MIIKRTVSINSDIDKFVREIYRILVFEGVKANYSIALNILLLAGILETQGRDSENDEVNGWSENTRDLIRDYKTKRRSLSEIIQEEVNPQDFRTDIPSP